MTSAESRRAAAGTWSWSAVWRAAASVSAFALPLGLAQNWLVDTDRIDANGTVNYLLFAGILLCGAVGGFGAAILVDERRLQHGAAAAALATMGIHAAGAGRRLIAGEPMSNPAAWVFTALLMATCGMIGAALERRTRGLRPRPTIREET